MRIFLALGIAAVLQVGSFSDDFEIPGALIDSGWTAFQPSRVPNARKVGGQYNSGTISSVGSATWFNQDRGRADWKVAAFPATGERQIIATNCGVGPASNPAGNLSAASPFAFTGLIVHVDPPTSINYEFLVVGRRSNVATIESKTTRNGTSTPDDVGPDPVGSGVTHTDLRVVLRHDKTLRWSYRASNSGSSWLPINVGHGSGVSEGGGLTYGSGSAWIGLITYAYEAVPTPFVGTCDAITLTDEQSIGLPEAPRSLRIIVGGSW